jgi:hypothetical protein
MTDMSKNGDAYLFPTPFCRFSGGGGFYEPANRLAEGKTASSIPIMRACSRTPEGACSL